MKFSNKEKNRLKETYGQLASMTGASSGIGFEITKCLAEAGLDLVICSRILKKLEEVETN
jgi:short-subunit dehydrogenase